MKGEGSREFHLVNLEIDEVRAVRTTLGPPGQHRAAENKVWEEDRRDSMLNELVMTCYCQEVLC